MSAFKDLTGQKFNRLTILELGERNSSGQIQWKCRCDCGNIVLVTTTYLKTGHTKSCGCLSREMASSRLQSEKFIKSRENYRKNKFLKENTSLALISNKKIRKNNTSGCTGVVYQKKLKKWRASIMFKGRRIELGCYSKIDDAIKARKEAEEKYFKPILEKYKEQD